MSGRTIRRVALVVAVAALAGFITAAAPGKPGPPGPPPPQPTPVTINASFDSFVNFNGNSFCPAAPPSGPVLVEGRGVATGPFGKFDSAIGTAEECSSGVFAFIPGTNIPNPGYQPPDPSLGCSNIAPGASYFDVHGQGVYMTKDGSVLYLSYHEVSENPFDLIFSQGLGHFSLHDCGKWQVSTDPTQVSTGIFAGVTGGGSISATVPIREDFSAHVNATYVGSLTFANGPKGPGPGGPPGPPGPKDTHCNGYMTGPITGNVTVDDGAFCELDDTAVLGDIHVHRGATLLMQFSIAAGNVDCNGCGALIVFPDTVQGDLHSDHAGATTVVSSIVGGDVDVHNGGPYTIELNYSIGHDLRVHDNSGSTDPLNPSTVAGNTAGHTVDCHGNTPDPTLSFQVPFPSTFGTGPTFTGNNAPGLKGQCSVFGPGPQGPSGP
jgi:hypothetical protein